MRSRRVKRVSCFRWRGSQSVSSVTHTDRDRRGLARERVSPRGRQCRICAVRYLRMLSNSVLAACVATAYVLTLVLHLNPMLPLHPVRLAPLVTTVGLFYAVHLTVACYILLVLRQLFARQVFSPAWISVDVLTWLCAIAAAAAAALMWANATTFGRVIDAGTTDVLRSS